MISGSLCTTSSFEIDILGLLPYEDTPPTIADITDSAETIVMDFDPRDYDSRRSERSGIERDPGSRGSADAPRQRDTEPRDVFVRDLRLPRGTEREVVHDSRDRAYTL